MNLWIRLENRNQREKKLQVVLGPTPDQLVSAKHPYRRMVEFFALLLLSSIQAWVVRVTESSVL